MALRLNSLKTRTALAITVAITALLVANAVLLLVTKRRELQSDIGRRATLFASLATPPICKGYTAFYGSGYYKFRELMREYLSREPDVERLLVTDVNGKILYDSTELEEASPPGEEPPVERRITSPDRLEAIKRLDPTCLAPPPAFRGVGGRIRRVLQFAPRFLGGSPEDPERAGPLVEVPCPVAGRATPGGEILEIIAPYLEEWGRHHYSVCYKISYRNLTPSIVKLVYATAGLTLLSILASVLIAVALASRITRPLEELTAGAQGISEGHFDHRLAIESNDEIQILAETFNHMSERLKENVQQLEKSNRKLGALNEELKELDRMKSDLLANVSHELRTPLTAIKGYTDYILDRKLGPVTEKQDKGLLVIQKNLDRLSRTINALLDFSRMDMGRIPLNLQPFSLAQLVEQIRTGLGSELEKRGLEFRAEMPEELPPVIADRDKISQVLENLVINAVKFTPAGGSIVVSAGKVVGSGRPSVEIRVSDTGIGIPQSQLGSIFNRFHQVDGSTTRKFGGVGLGLAIVKSILDAHGATITAHSEEGHGASFFFALPLREKAEPVPRVREKIPVHPGTVVLIVDDDPEVRRVVSGYLKDEGMEVLTAETAEEGAELARKGPSLILLDLLLPDRSGLDLLESLKGDPATRDIPVLVVSIAHEDVKALALGAAECLLKPVERGLLLATARKILDGVDSEEPTVLVVDDEIDTADFIRSTLRSEGFKVLVAHDGRGGLEMARREHPDLILLDIMMPDLSGFEVLEAISSDPATAGIPVVVLTARGDPVDADRGLSLGARKYVSKPFDVRALVDEVRRLATHRAAGARRAAL
jgi:signal transduction histidine kinase/DNA-binding response OmpR family regulator